MTSLMEKDALAGAGLTPAIERLAHASAMSLANKADTTILQRSFVVSLIDLLTRCRDTLEQTNEQNIALRAALHRIVASDDAHVSLHAEDGDDIARMLEYSAAFDNARAVLKVLS